MSKSKVINRLRKLKDAREAAMQEMLAATKRLDRAGFLVERMLAWRPHGLNLVSYEAIDQANAEHLEAYEAAEAAMQEFAAIHSEFRDLLNLVREEKLATA